MQLTAAVGGRNILHFHCLFEWKNESSAVKWRDCDTVKLNFRPYIGQYTSPNENFEYGYPLIICLMKPLQSMQLVKSQSQSSYD